MEISAIVYFADEQSHAHSLPQYCIHAAVRWWRCIGMLDFTADFERPETEEPPKSCQHAQILNFTAKDHVNTFHGNVTVNAVIVTFISQMRQSTSLPARPEWRSLPSMRQQFA